MNQAAHRLSEVDTDSRQAVCCVCGPTEIVGRGSGRVACRATRPKQRLDSIRQPSGLTAKETRSIVQAAESCEICGGEPEALDHNHATGALRGVLCKNCNVGLYWLERPGWIRDALAYLLKHGTEIDSGASQPHIHT